MSQGGFDPIISLNSHVALLKMVDEAKKEVETAKGIKLLAVKALGRALTEELDNSRENMKLNKMWVHESPIGEMRYSYSLFGRREEHEISQSDLDKHIGMILGELDRLLAQSV